ncbi:MAG: nuclear transport factor 2 family protein [Halioglobus sp.]|nr:nuclear transport factor 2 family protein [Halioglobus sp.]
MSAALEQRIARLEAVEAVKQLKYRYFRACDRKQPEVVRACFAPGEIDLQYGRIGNFSSRDDMVAVFSTLACQEHIVEMHHGQNPEVTVVDPDNATATWGLYYYMIDTRRNVVTQLGGFYDDAYVRINGEWLINKSHYEVSSTAIYNLADGPVQPVFAGAAAPVELDDPSAQAG